MKLHTYSINDRFLIHVGVPIVAMAFMVALIWTGRINFLSLITISAIATFTLWHFPQVGIFLLLLFSTQNFYLVSMDNLPFWQIMSGLRLNIADALLLLLTAMACIKLVRRRTRPVFLPQVLILAGLTAVSLSGGILSGSTNFDVGLGAARTMSAYAFYFVLVEHMNSRHQMQLIVKMIFFIALVATVIQLWEVGTGQRLSFGLTNRSYYEEMVYIDIKGMNVPYLWNRATEYLFVMLFLSLGCIFEGQRIRYHTLFVIIALLSFGISLVRQWQIYILIGFFSILMLLLHTRRFKTVILSSLGVTTLIAIFPLASSIFKPLIIWASRLQTLTNPFQESTFVIRVDLFKAGFEYFQKSPILGYGLSPLYLQLYNSDIGFINTLLAFGLIGLAAIIFLNFSVIKYAYISWKQSSASLEKGYLLGILGLFVAIGIGYLFTTDSFTRSSGIWMVSLVMAIADRSTALYKSVIQRIEL